MVWDYDIVLLLVLSGVLVGFVNTLAGGGSVMSMAIFMALGLPVADANGTNRIAVVLQNLTSALTFLKKRMVDVRVCMKLAVPTVVGNIAGSQVASTVDEKVFEACLGVVLFIVVLFMIFDGRRVKRDGHSLVIRPVHYLWFLFIGFYCGYIYIGIGYLVLAVTLWSMRLDIVTANVIKALVICVATPFSLIIFMWHGQVHYGYGLLHALGNVVGAFLASHYAVGWKTSVIKSFMVVIVLLCFIDLLTPYDYLHAFLTRLLE